MNNREHPLIAAIKRTLADPGATRRMVLEQGKAFVYLSDDEQFIDNRMARRLESKKSRFGTDMDAEEGDG